jgi:hypothetical protein
MIVVISQRAPDRLEALASRPVDVLVSRLLSSSLDRKLAAGCSPESNRLLATRAQILVARGTRRTLAHTLEEVLENGLRPHQAGRRRVSLCRDGIRAAESELRTMITYLSEPLPVPARGVAMVVALLRDGMGPLYNPNCESGLRSVARDVRAALDPSRQLDWSA